MTILVDDPTGLSATRMRDQPLVDSDAEAKRLYDLAVDHSLSLAGARHSQGGHCAVEDGRMLLTMPGFNRIHPLRGVPAGLPWRSLLPLEAGATWEDSHRVLGPYGFAPMVQQSSPHFTVGGSLSVNCHGRDPRWGPVSASVEDVTVLTGRGDVVTASRTTEPGLWRAALGGFGGCGMILGATLRVIGNRLLGYVGDTRERSVAQYVALAEALPSQPDIHLHYAWLCCVPDRFYRECLVAAFVDLHPPQREPAQRVFKENEWGEGEVLRAGWSAARKSSAMRALVWKELRDRHCVGGEGGKGSHATRIDWLRASVSFTAYRGPSSADLLQEYFVPLDALEEFIAQLAPLFLSCPHLNVLSTTLRVVRADDETLLSYCPGQTHACVAVDAAVATVGEGQARDIHSDVRRVLERAIRLALDAGGRYYLPYARIADEPTFRRAYPGHEAMREAIERWNPVVGGRRRFWNRFLAQHFA